MDLPKLLHLFVYFVNQSTPGQVSVFGIVCDCQIFFFTCIYIQSSPCFLSIPLFLQGLVSLLRVLSSLIHTKQTQAQITSYININTSLNTDFNIIPHIYHYFLVCSCYTTSGCYGCDKYGVCSTTT